MYLAYLAGRHPRVRLGTQVLVVPWHDPVRLARIYWAPYILYAKEHESEIPIGETVMEHFRELDDVAYVRFASVYRNFREAKDFETALAELSGDEAAE